MERAVNFQFPGGSFLLRLEELMDLDAFRWEVDMIEGYYDVREGLYSGAQLREALSMLSDNVAVRLRRYPLSGPTDDFDTYEQYLESPCSFVFLYFDGGWYEIYAKDLTLLHALYDACIAHGGEGAEIVTDETDGRTRMYY